MSSNALEQREQTLERRTKDKGHYRHPWEEIGKEEASLERIHGDPTDPKREKHSGAEAMAAGG